MNRREYLLQNLRRYSTLEELRRSPFFSECHSEIESTLATPEIFSNPMPEARQGPFLRVVQWNIEKGKQYRAIVEAFRTHEILRRADVILLNEADCGMNRSGNLPIARSLATELGMNMVFGPAHFELTKGTGEDLAIPGENRDSIQGNAVLSRYPILEARTVALPVCFESYEFHEKRFGWRNCVWARLKFTGGALWVGTTHLEVRNTPGCRAAQMKYLLEHLPGERSDHYLLGGDLNANGFPRGTLWRTLKSTWLVTFTPPERIRERLRHPERGTEPLFQIARAAGFSWARLNSFEDTASAPIGGLEDAAFLPGFVSNRIRKRLAPYRGYLDLKLDWLLGKGIRAVKRDEIRDREVGASSMDPGCVRLARTGPGRISDHNPVFADISIWGSLP